MKASNANKAVSVLLSVAMCPMMVPTAAFADEGGTQPGSPVASEQAGDAQSAESTADQAGTAAADAAATGTVTVNGGASYDSLEAAVAAATPDDNGVITYTINGKVMVSDDSTEATAGWTKILIFDEAKYTDDQVKEVRFVEGGESAEVCIDSYISVLGTNKAVAVSFSDLTLSRTKAKGWRPDIAEGTDYFTMLASGGSVSYSNCDFPNGCHSNWYGSTAFDNCRFANARTSTGGQSKYGLWASADGKGSDITLSNCSFTENRGIKLYYTALSDQAPSLCLTNTTFSNLKDADYAAITVCQPANISMNNVKADNCPVGLLKKGFVKDDPVGIDAGLDPVIIPCGSNVSGNFNLQASDTPTEKEFAISGGTFTNGISSDYCADGFEVKDNGDGTYGVQESQPTTINVAEVLDKNGKVTETYTDLKAAAKAAKTGYTVRLLANAVVDSAIVVNSGTRTFDLGSFRITNKGTSTVAAVIKTTGSASVVVNADPTGGIDAGSGAGANYAFYASGGTITVNGGYYTVGLDKDGNGNPVAYADKGGRYTGKIVVNGGTFDAEDPAYTVNAKDGSGASIEVNGGTFKGFDPFNNDTEGAGTNLVPEGSGVTRTVAEDGTVSYAVAKGVAQVVDANGKSVRVYETLQEAIDAAESGQAIKLTGDVAADQISDKREMQFTKDGVNITIDLNGKTITANADEAVNLNAANITLTLKNGAISNFHDGDYSDGIYAFKLCNGLNLTLEGITLKSRTQSLAVQGLTSGSNVNIVNSAIASDSLGIYYPPKSGTLTIKGSSISGQTGVVVKGGTVNVSGNTTITATGEKVVPSEYYDGNPNGSLTLTGDAIYVESGYNDRNIDLAISEGVFKSANGQALQMFVKPGEVTSVARDIEVSGGSFSSPIDENFCADGFQPTTEPSADGTYTVESLPEGALLLGKYKGDREQSKWIVPSSSESGKVFAGWYQDSEFATPCDPEQVTGVAYPKFVDAQNVIKALGGSLRIDDNKLPEGGYSYEKASLRFGYTINLPEGASLSAWSWDWGLSEDALTHHTNGKNKVVKEDGSITSNLVLTRVMASAFTAKIYSQMSVVFKTADGTAVSLADEAVLDRSVEGVAQAVVDRGYDSNPDALPYCQGLLNSMKQ